MQKRAGMTHTKVTKEFRRITIAVVGLSGLSAFFCLVGLAGLLEGCATIQSGDYGVPLDQHNRPAARPRTDSALKISAAEIGALSSRHFGAIEITFENNSDAWVQIDRVDLDFGTPEKNRAVLIPWGSDIDTWEAATLQRNAIRAANTQTALALVAVGGGLMQAAAGGRGPGRVGGAIEAGALAAIVGGELADAVHATERVERFPATHILSTPIRIPPGLFTKRWLLLNTAEHPLGGCLDSVILGYEIADRPRERTLLRFKNTDSEWQRQSCWVTGPGMNGQHG